VSAIQDLIRDFEAKLGRPFTNTERNEFRYRLSMTSFDLPSEALVHGVDVGESGDPTALVFVGEDAHLISHAESVTTVESLGRLGDGGQYTERVQLLDGGYGLDLTFKHERLGDREIHARREAHSPHQGADPRFDEDEAARWAKLRERLYACTLTPPPTPLSTGELV
jgi:hypothetical protein